MPTREELLHYRLQALIREHSFPDLEYIGEDDRGHKYRIGNAEVYAEQITELDAVEEEDDAV